MASRYLLTALAVLYLMNAGPATAESRSATISNNAGGLGCYTYDDTVIAHARLGAFGPPTGRWRDNDNRAKYYAAMITTVRYFSI